MAKHGQIELDWADGTYSFRLGLGEIRELEEKAAAGIFTIADQLSPTTRSARSHVISETIRLGLIGGGTDAATALRLVRRYVDEVPLIASLLVAYSIAMAAITRVSGDKAEEPSPGEAEAAETD